MLIDRSRCVFWGVLISLIVSTGCTTRMVKERQITKSRIDEDGRCFDVEVEQESAQHLSYSLFLPVIGHVFFWYPPLSFGNEWEIRYQACLLYRRGDSVSGVREDREIQIEADHSPFIMVMGEEMKAKQEIIFKYVMGLVDVARQRAGQPAAVNSIFPEHELKWVISAKRLPEELDGESQVLLADSRDAELVERCRQVPYTVEAAALPTYTFSVTVTYTEVDVETGKETIKFETKTYTVTSPPIQIDLVDPTSEFTVRIVRHFSDLQSGRGLGGVKETYHLKPGQEMGSAVSLPMLK